MSEFVYPRSHYALIKHYLRPNKVVVLLGPRRVGKTFLMKRILSELEEPYVYLNGEDLNTHKLFSYRSVASLSKIVGQAKFLAIDEAQKIPDIGPALKLMVDEIDGLKIFVTGSSAFDIMNHTGEPLTGRKITLNLYGLSEGELIQVEPYHGHEERMTSRLIYGNYPELLQLTSDFDRRNYLDEVVNSYLLKDILAFETIRNPSKIIDLLRLVGFQIGGVVSTTELGNALQMSKNTVDKYLYILTQVYILHKVSGFSRNLRKEISKSDRYYFLDNGIRNALIGNLNPLHLRNDTGLLWENYMISERIKFQNYRSMLSYNYFWRTYDRQEIDWIEDRGGILHAYEFKWNEKKKAKVPAVFARTYPESTFRVINRENYLEWLTGEMD